MTAAALLSFPGSRVVAGWWRQLALLRPHSLWVGHFLIQRVEALVEVSRPLKLDPLARHVLQAVALPGNRTLHGLDARLRLGPQVLLRVLRRLEADGLVMTAGGEVWESAPPGRQVVDGDAADVSAVERRVFAFISPWPVPGEAGQPPQFLQVSARASNPALPPGDGAFDPSLLAACTLRPAGWKQRHAFPTDVRSILAPDSRGELRQPALPEWQQVVLVQPEHLVAVLALVGPGTGDEQLIGFGVRPEGWELDPSQRAFALDAGWPETFPGLAGHPSADAWREAWRAWCQPRGMPPAERDACNLESQGCRLRARAPRRLVDRLRAARSDALKGEAWLLAGTGSLRALALLDVVETELTSAPAG